jgi:hypothetical protein
LVVIAVRRFYPAEPQFLLLIGGAVFPLFRAAKIILYSGTEKLKVQFVLK